MNKSEAMTIESRALAVDELSEAIQAADIRVGLQPRERIRRITGVVTSRLPSREAAIAEGQEQLTERMKAETKTVLKGVVFLFALSVFWQVAVAVVATIIVRWLFSDNNKRALIDRARAG